MSFYNSLSDKDKAFAKEIFLLPNIDTAAPNERFIAPDSRFGHNIQYQIDSFKKNLGRQERVYMFIDNYTECMYRGANMHIIIDEYFYRTIQLMVEKEDKQ